MIDQLREELRAELERLTEYLRLFEFSVVEAYLCDGAKVRRAEILRRLHDLTETAFSIGPID